MHERMSQSSKPVLAQRSAILDRQVVSQKREVREAYEVQIPSLRQDV